MQTVLFHPSRCEEVIEPLLGKKALRPFESVLEDETLDRKMKRTVSTPFMFNKTIGPTWPSHSFNTEGVESKPPEKLSPKIFH